MATSVINIISSQSFLDQEIVKKKMLLKENWIYISPPFIHNNEIKTVLLDGHHNLQAAKNLNREPLIQFVGDEFLDGAELLFWDEIDDFLDWSKNDTDWYKIHQITSDAEPVNQ